MTACLDCGLTHRTGLDGIRCDLNTHGEEFARRRLALFGLHPHVIDGLIKQAEDQP